MNTPTGFSFYAGKVANVDPIGAMMNPSALGQTVHMLLAAYAAAGFAVAGIHAFLVLRDKQNLFHRHALAIALAVGGVTALLQPLSGDLLGQALAKNQPVKLAAMEGQFKTEKGAPLRIGGWPDENAKETRYALEIPRGLSLIAFHDPNATVRGLESFPRDEWPPVAIVHIAFQVMVAAGTVMMLIAVWAAWQAWRRKNSTDSKWFLRAVVATSPLGFIAIEAGWIVTEVGRQPWIINGLMRTSEAVTPMPGLVVPFVFFTLLYLALGVAVVWLLKRQISDRPRIYGDVRKTTEEGVGYAFD
jgi:cytochrome d ubiquinol oxidase subunit I